MNIQKVKSALIKANKAEERFFKAESELFKDVDISVKSFIDLVSKLKRKLELEDIISIFLRGERMKSDIRPIPFEKAKIIQTVIRTFDTHIYIDNNLHALNEKLNNGWLVVNVTPMAHYIEYILQKEEE